ncbi:MAG: hypothetical protein P8I13_00040 [Porticoccaceae bacterium]|jgi:hypothetical protein|nr:hypothetical protein [Porticoccaceae bacterium]
MSKFESVKRELEIEKEKQLKNQDSDIVKKTVANLIQIEKDCLFGLTSGKKSKIEDNIHKSIAKYKEQKNAS